MKKEDKKELQKMLKEQNLHLEKRMKVVFAKGFEQIMVPHLDRIYKKQEEHDEQFIDIKDTLKQIKGIQRAEIDRDDRQDEVIEEIEEKIKMS